MSEQPSTSLDQEKIKKDLQKFEDGRGNDYKEIRTHALTLLDTYEIQASCLPSFDAVNDSGWKNSFDGTVTVQDRINAYEKLAYELSQEIKQASNMSNFHRQNSIIDELSQRIMQAHNNITSTIAQKNKSTLSISTQGNQNDTTLDQHNTSILYQKNLALRTKPGKTKDILQELPRQMDTWSKKIVEENAHNPVYQQHIIKTMNRARVAFQKRPITTKEINTICVNMLLMLNDASQTDITDMSKFEEPSVSAIYEFQKKYETISGWSAADGIVGPKTIQQLCHNIGITLDQITLEGTFARDKAKSIDKESGYTYKQFVVEGLNTYKAYLRTIESQMHLQLFSGADEALDAHIITLEQAIFNIQNSTMHDYEIAGLIDTLILNPRDMRSWIQSLNGIGASYFDTLLQSFSESATVQLTNLLKKPGNFQTAKQSMLDIFRSIDQVNGTIERKSEAYADLARTEASKSREAYNDTDLKQMLDRIRTTMSDASHVDQIKDIITDSSVSDKEKTIKNYIANTMKGSTRNDNLFNQKLAYMFDTDEMENLVKSISDMIKNEGPNKIKMKQEITEEKKKLAVLSDNNKLNEDGQLRLQALTQATENDDSGDTYINDAYQASISTTISSILEDYMVSNALAKYDPHAYRRRDTIGLYADIKGVGNATSDQVSNIITNTAIDLGVEIAIAMVSFATAGAAGVAIYGTRLAASTAAKATVRTLLSRVGTLFPKLLTKEGMGRVGRALARNAVKGAAYTTTSEVLRNARTAKDWSDYGTNLLSGMKNNFLSNTAMLGILKYLGGSFQALKVTSTNVSKPLASLTKREAIKMTQEMVKNRAIAGLGFFATEGSIATVDYVSKALIGAGPYSPEDFINTLAEGLAFELIGDMVGGGLKLPRHSTPTRSNGQSLLPVLHNNQDATLVIKGDHATLTQNGKNIQTIDLTNHRQSRQEQLASINQKINEICKGRDDMKIETTLQKYFNKDVSQKIKDAVCKDFNTDHNGMQQLRQLWDTKKRLEESLKHTQDPATISTDQSLIRTRSQITENHRATSALEQQVQDPATLTNQENATKFIADTKANLTSISPKWYQKIYELLKGIGAKYPSLNADANKLRQSIGRIFSLSNKNRKKLQMYNYINNVRRVDQLMQEKDGGLLTDAMRDFISYDDNTPIAYMRATIKQIQKDVGLKGKEIDGIIGPKTEAAITQYFQKLESTSTQGAVATKAYTSKSKDGVDASRTEQNKQPEALTKRDTQLTTHNEKIQKIRAIKNLDFKQKRDFVEKFDMNQASTDELIVLYYAVGGIGAPLDWNIDSNNPLNQRLKQKILTELLPVHISHDFENSPNLTLSNQRTSLSFQAGHGYDIQVGDQKYAIVKDAKSGHIELHHITAVGSTSPQEVILTKNSPRHVISEPNHGAIQNEMVKGTVLTLQDDGHVLVQDFNSVHGTTIKTLSDSGGNHININDQQQTDNTRNPNKDAEKKADNTNHGTTELPPNPTNELDAIQAVKDITSQNMTKADISSYQQLLQWFDHVLQKFPNISIKETIVKWVTYIQEKIGALLRLKLFTKKPKNAADAKEAVNDMIQQMSTKAPGFHLIFEDIIKRLNDYLRQFPGLSKFIQNIKNKIQSYPSLEQTISLQGGFEDDTTYEVEQGFNFTKITDTLQGLKKESGQFQITFNNQYKYLNPGEQYTYYIGSGNDQRVVHIHYTTQDKVLLTCSKDIATINKRNTGYIDKQILGHNTYEYAHASDTMIDSQTAKGYACSAKGLKAGHNEDGVFVGIKDGKVKVTIVDGISTGGGKEMKDRILDAEEAQFGSNKTQSAILNSAISRTQNSDSGACYASIEISAKKKLTLTWMGDTIAGYIKNGKMFYTTPHAASFEDIKGRAYNPNAMETDLKLHASAVTHQANNVVTKAVGNHTIKDNEISTHTVQLAKGDLIFGGTDGITDYVGLQEIQDIVNQNTDHKGIVNCQKVMTEVSLLAYQRNSHDNVSFTIMQIQ